MSAELIELSNALAQITDHAAASVVAVHAEARGSSSGVLWREGVIVTAEHALRRDEEIQATLPDGRVVPATLAGRDPSTDLAVLKCAEAGNRFVERGDASVVEALKQLAGDTTIDLFAKIPHGSGQTYFRVLVLVIDHNAHHLGQLILVRRLLGAWK